MSGAQAIGYATDHLGSVLNSLAAGPFNSYGPFGETLPGWMPNLAWNSDAVNYGYAGRQFDSESGQYYNRARQYSPMTGRFTTKDPLGLTAGSMNLYLYLLNDPINYTDPSGKTPLGPVLGIITVVVVIYIVYDYFHNQLIIAPDPDLNVTPVPVNKYLFLPPGSDPGRNYCGNTCC